MHLLRTVCLSFVKDGVLQRSGCALATAGLNSRKLVVNVHRVFADVAFALRPDLPKLSDAYFYLLVLR